MTGIKKFWRKQRLYSNGWLRAAGRVCILEKVEMYWIGVASEYFRRLMKITSTVIVGSFPPPAKCAQFGSFKTRESKTIRMERVLRGHLWCLTPPPPPPPANFPVNDIPVIYSGGCWLFCLHNLYSFFICNMYYDFLREATLPHHILLFDWVWIHPNP